MAKFTEKAQGEWAVEHEFWLQDPHLKFQFILL